MNLSPPPYLIPKGAPLFIRFSRLFQCMGGHVPKNWPECIKLYGDIVPHVLIYDNMNLDHKQDLKNRHILSNKKFKKQK